MAKATAIKGNKKVESAINGARVTISPIKMILDNGHMSPGTVNGLLVNAMRESKSRVIMYVPVDLLAIDTRYQTDVRTERELSYLITNWDEAKLLPPTVVPDFTRGCFHVVDGYGRVVASQVVSKERYKEMECLVLLNAPNDEENRLKYEAEQYAFQNKNVMRMEEPHKHGAYMIMDDKAALLLDALQEEYGYSYAGGKGHRDGGVLGSYNDCRSIIKGNGEQAFRYIMTICKDSGFNSKSNGLGRRYLRSFLAIWKAYPEHRMETAKYLGDTLRKMEPIQLQSFAMKKYPLLGHENAVRMYVEDMVVSSLKLPKKHACYGKQIINI